MPLAQFRMFGFEETGDESSICSVTLVSAELLHSEGFDLMGIDEVEAGESQSIEPGSDGIAIVTCLLKAGAGLPRRCNFDQPLDEAFDSFGSIVETLGDGVIRTDDMAE